MDGDEYRIATEWKDTVRYVENGEAIMFDCGSMGTPIHVAIPTELHWKLKTPAWAHERRDLIITRLRKAGYVIDETGPGYYATGSEDGLLKVEASYEVDDRGFRDARVCVVAMPDNRRVVEIADCSTSGDIEFPAPGIVVVPLLYARKRRVVRIDTRTNTYGFHAAEDEPLQTLSARLREPAADVESNTLSYSVVVPRSGKTLIGAILFFLGSIIMTAAGALAGFVIAKRPSDRWIGGASVVFFGFCTYASTLELLEVLAARRRGGR